jgi:hypothetical protein
MADLISGMTQMCCGQCGIEFAVPDAFYRERKEKGAALNWHCPNGHIRVFRESNSEVLRRERDLLKQQTARLEDEARLARERADKAEKATKRLKKRASAGTCPCCNRTFANMAEHMKHQHPEMLTEGGTKVVPIRRPRAAQ